MQQANLNLTPAEIIEILTQSPNPRGVVAYNFRDNCHSESKIL